MKTNPVAEMKKLSKKNEKSCKALSSLLLRTNE